jgi:anti-sigma factor RsiW
MTDHLSQPLLNALADGELSADQLVSANQHLAGCQSCTSSALYLSLLKSATAKAGQRYVAQPHLRERLMRLSSESPEFRTVAKSPSPSSWQFGSLGWAAAAALLLVAVSIGFIQRNMQRSRIASSQHAALVNEVFDQHVATLAASLPPQVLSTDRHTVKPWFQGKIPFSFNLPENLPGNTTLDGANLTYLDNQPVAQLLYSIGKHRVSVFVRQKPGAAQANGLRTDHSGFHVMGFDTGDLEMVAISDADPAHLAELVNVIRQAQTGVQKPSN